MKPEHFPDSVLKGAGGAPSVSAPASAEPELIPLANLERDYLRRAVATHAGDRKSLAAALGISERALYRKIAELREDSEG